MKAVATTGLLRFAQVALELLGAAGILICLPLVILIIGTPIVLSVRLMAWIVGAL